MARLAVILAVILSLFVLSHGRLPLEPTSTTTTTAAAAATTSESATDADSEPSKSLDPTAYVVPINQIGDGSLPAGDILRHIDFSLRRPFHHHFHHFHGHRRHRMREMEIALGADAIGFPGDRIQLRSGEEKGLVKEEEEEIKGENPAKEETEEIEKREGDSDSDSDSDDEEDEKMEKRKRKCKKHKKKHHLHHFRHHHHHHRDEEDDGEKSGLMQRFWDFLNHF